MPANPLSKREEVRFTWNIHWSCNYRCSYCFFDADWAEYGRRNVYQTVDEWVVHWKRIHDRYGNFFHQFRRSKLAHRKPHGPSYNTHADHGEHPAARFDGRTDLHG